MKKFSKLVAVSAAAMTFGITGVSALQVASASNVSSTYATNLKNAQSNMDKVNGYGSGAALATDKKVLDDTANMILTPSNNETPQDVLRDTSLHTATCLGSGLKADENTVEDTAATDISNVDNSAKKAQLQSLWQAEDGVLNAIYANTNEGSNAQQPAAQNANKQTANNDNKQNANNNNNANAQSNSSSKKADVTANADNNAKNNNVQGAVENKQNTNNEANAQQNTVKSNANVEGAKTITNENESNSAKNQNNGAIAETQNENTTAAGETSTVVKAQAKSASNSAAQKNNTPVFPQTGEQTSEILAVAGGLIIAATAAGIVVYKKRN